MLLEDELLSMWIVAVTY